MNLTLTSGDAYTGDRRLTVTVTDPDGGATDLTGIALSFLVKRRRSDAVATIEKLTPTDVAITDAPGGIARIILTEADTAALSGKYLWELEADDAEGKLTLASGGFYVVADLITG